MLTAQSLNREVTVFGKRVVAFNGSEEKNFGVRRNAQVHQVNSLYEFTTKVSDKKRYNGGLIDSYVGGASEVLKDESNGFYIQEVFEHQFMYGFVLSNEFAKTGMTKCLIKAVTLREDDIIKMVSTKIHPLPELNEDKYTSLTTSVFSATSIVFQMTAIRCAVIIGVFLLCGIIWQKVFKKGEAKNKIGEYFVTEDDVILDKTPDGLIKRQLQEYEDLLVSEVLLYINAFQKRQNDLKLLISNPILHKQLANIINDDDIHFAKYSGTY